MALNDTNAVIYGGGGAIGGAVARVFAREGARVFLVGRTRAKLEAVAHDIRRTGGLVDVAEVDVRAEDAVNAHAVAVAARVGSIDVALNAISVLHDQGTPMAELPTDAFMLPIVGFLRPLFITSKAVAPHMGRRRPGVILTLSTPASKLTTPGHLGYIVTCAGTEAFSRALADELAPRHIRVVCIRPHALADGPAAGSYTGALFEPKAAAVGLSVSDWLAGAAQGTMLKRLPTLQDVAEVAAFLASDAAGAMTATVANLTCGALPD